MTPLTFDLSSPGFVQQPACGYTLAETFTWEIESGAPVTSTGDYTAVAESNTASDRGDYTITLIDSANYAGTGVTYSASVSWTVTITDPCLTTVLESLTIPDVSVEAGLTDTFSFAELTDSAGTAVGDQSICGERTYTVFEIEADGTRVSQSIVTFTRDDTGVAHTLVTETMDEDNDVGAHDMELVVSLPDVLYPPL